MAEQFKMVVVDGVRYRPEDAPKRSTSSKVQHKARTPEKTAKGGNEK